MKHIEIKHIETALDWVDDATDEQLEEGITAFLADFAYIVLT